MPAHPMVVHFPLALIVTGTLCLNAVWVRPAHRAAPTLAVVGTWNLCAGALCVILALGTGLAAVLDLQIGSAARAAVLLHAKWAVLTSCLLLLAAVWRSAGTASDSRPSILFTLVLALCLAGCARTQNIKEGETDYPRENPRPINVVHLSGTVDAPIRVKSVANWSAAGKGGESGGAAPLTTTAADGFLAGRCGWHFSGMTIEGRGISGFA